MDKTESTSQPATGLSGKPETEHSRWWKRKWLRISAISAVAAIVVIVGVRMALPTMVVAVGNRKLSERLAAPATLSAIDLGLLDYRVTLQGLRINQPAGFGDDLFLNLPEARVTMVLSSLFGSPLTIEEVRLENLSVHVVRNKDGTLNLLRLLQPAPATPETTKAKKPIHVERIAVENLTVRYTDFALNEAPVDITIKRFNAVVTDVYLDASGSDDQPLPGRAEMTGYFVQPGLADAPLGIIARFGPVDTDQPIPAANAALRLAGVELQPWHALVPQGMPQAIGGNIIDFNADAVFSSDALDCRLAIVTPAGDALKLNVGGTPRQAEVKQNSIRGIVASRAREAGFNTLGDMGDTGVELGRTAFSSAASAGKGAATTVWATATGLFKTASSVSKGEVAGGGANLLGTLRDTVTNTGDMVGDTGASLITGGAKSASAAAGGNRNQQWRADTQERWARSWEQARRSVAEISAPGHTAKSLTDDEHHSDQP